MRKSERPNFIEIIEALAATFRTEATVALCEGYWLGLEDLDIRAVKSAAVQAMRSCRFMPAVAELRELAGVLSPNDRAVLAWNAVQKAQASHGYYHSVNFDDPVINATIRTMGGWMRFEERSEERDAETWLRKDFQATYAALCRSGIGPDLAAPLLGYNDQQNQLTGHTEAVKGPVAIETGLPSHGQEVVRLPGQRSRRALPTSEPLAIESDIGRMPT